VLVRVEAASVNPIDTYVREGDIEPAGGLPHVGRSDVAGVVESVGDDATEFVTGDRVFTMGLGVFFIENLHAVHRRADGYARSAPRISVVPDWGRC